MDPEGPGNPQSSPSYSICTVSPSQTASAFSTADEGEVKDVNPGEAAIRTPRVLALASVPTPARVGSCPAKPCASEQVPWRDSARHQLRLS